MRLNKDKKKQKKQRPTRRCPDKTSGHQCPVFIKKSGKSCDSNNVFRWQFTNINQHYSFQVELTDECCVENLRSPSASVRQHQHLMMKPKFRFVKSVLINKDET